MTLLALDFRFYTSEENERRACSILEGGPGSYLDCPDNNYAVKSVCASGQNGDCGLNVYNRIMCCDGV